MARKLRIDWRLAAFGPFGRFESNPALEIGREVVPACEALEVSFGSVLAWLEGLESSDWQTLLVLGVSGGASGPTLELVGRNRVGPTPDVTGEVWGPGSIHPGGPPALSASLFGDEATLDPAAPWQVSTDAGDYLCNFVLFEALRRFPDRRIGFVHVAPLETAPLVWQAEVLDRLLGALQA